MEVGEGNKAPPGTELKELLKDATDRETVVPIIVVLRIDRRTIDVEIVHIVTIVASRRPEVAVAALIVGRAAVEVAGKRSA